MTVSHHQPVLSYLFKCFQLSFSRKLLQGRFQCNSWFCQHYPFNLSESKLFFHYVSSDRFGSILSDTSDDTHFAYPYSSPLKFPSFLVTCFPFILFSLLIEWSEDFNEFIDGRLASPGFYRPFQWSGHGRLPCNIFYACLNGRSLNNVGMNRVKWQMSLSRIPRFYSPEFSGGMEQVRVSSMCMCYPTFLFPLFELFPSSQDINHLEHKHLVHLLRLEGLPASSSIHKSCNTFDPFRVCNCRTIVGREWEQRTWLEWLQLDFPSFPFRLTSLFPDNWDIRVLSSISISNKAKHSNWCDPKMRREAGAHLHLSVEKNRK